eukprot:COSAG02_NODE_33222_length_503_cov_1.217822_1_plen_27_part_10
MQLIGSLASSHKLTAWDNEILPRALSS